MAATVPVFLKHTFLGKATQQRPYTARAHSRYIARRSATHYHHAENMPRDYQERQRWYKALEDGLRCNGRIVDKFTVSVPHGVTQEHAAETITRFARDLGQGRAPFEFSLQGWDSPNHHAHVIYCDFDPETRKRVYGTTDRNSTRGIKLRWEEVANATFAELGYDIRVKVKDGPELAAEPNTYDPETSTEDTREGEADMARMLPTVTVGEVTLYVDERLGELRDKESPEYRYSLGGEPLDAWAPPLTMDDSADVIAAVNAAIAAGGQPLEDEGGEKEPASVVDAAATGVASPIPVKPEYTAYEDTLEPEVHAIGRETREGEDLGDPVTAVRRVFDARRHLSHIREVRERLATAELGVDYWMAQHQKAKEEAGAHLSTELLASRQRAYQSTEAFKPHVKALPPLPAGPAPAGAPSAVAREMGKLVQSVVAPKPSPVVAMAQRVMSALTAKRREAPAVKLKGFELKGLGLRVASPARREAEAALSDLARDQHQRERHERIQARLQEHEQVAAQREAEALERVEKQRDYIVGVFGSLADLEREEKMYGQTLSHAAAAVTQEEAKAAFIEGGIDADEYRVYLEATGNAAELVALDEQFEDGGASL